MIRLWLKVYKPNRLTSNLRLKPIQNNGLNIVILSTDNNSQGYKNKWNFTFSVANGNSPFQ